LQAVSHIVEDISAVECSVFFEQAKFHMDKYMRI
jgi:hypothetical protein